MPFLRDLNNYQKVNHFPHSFELGRKDLMYRNFHNLEDDCIKSLINVLKLIYYLMITLGSNLNNLKNEIIDSYGYKNQQIWHADLVYE